MSGSKFRIEIAAETHPVRTTLASVQHYLILGQTQRDPYDYRDSNIYVGHSPHSGAWVGDEESNGT